jgi:hypothetical protein
VYGDGGKILLTKFFLDKFPVRDKPSFRSGKGHIDISNQIYRIAQDMEQEE